MLTEINFAVNGKMISFMGKDLDGHCWTMREDYEKFWNSMCLKITLLVEIFITNTVSLKSMNISIKNPALCSWRWSLPTNQSAPLMSATLLIFRSKRRIKSTWIVLVLNNRLFWRKRSDRVILLRKIPPFQAQ